MAKPIKVTPVLRGQDAVTFIAKMESNKTKQINAEQLQSIQDEAKKLRQLLRTR